MEDERVRRALDMIAGMTRPLPEEPISPLRDDADADDAGGIFFTEDDFERYSVMVSSNQSHYPHFLQLRSSLSLASSGRTCSRSWMLRAVGCFPICST